MTGKSVLFTIVALVTLLTSAQALAVVSMDPAAERSESTAANMGERHYLLDPVELSPVTGFTVIDSGAGYNIGMHGSYPLLSRTPLYAEASMIAGLYSSRTQFNLTAAARYDIGLANTQVRPFVRAGIGPTFQTAGATVVFNATFGGGILYPINSTLSLRAEAALVDIDGSAGLQITGGISL
ncbi:MAG: hypothetical protein HY074_11790 [Deltaproteobacteria bacterium]|nr:hypothetical protein [Deltaproteobacteria bacterium]